MVKRYEYGGKGRKYVVLSMSRRNQKKPKVRYSRTLTNARKIAKRQKIGYTWIHRVK